MSASGAETMDVVRDWAESGAFALTGRADGPPILPPGAAASTARSQLIALGREIPGLLGERAAYAGLTRRGPWSCGGAFRVLATADGHVGLSLARPSDVELVPALVSRAVVDEPWATVSAWAADQPTSAAAERLRLLGMPGGAVPDPQRSARPPVRVTTLGERRTTVRPLVVDLTSLWAGPLCAHLLGSAGAEIVKVESAGRPDGARFGPAGFFTMLHSGHRGVTLDFGTQLDQLRALVRRADLVLTSSRPRAFAQLGLAQEDVVAAGTSWLSITARGLDSDSVGFGDDVAASAGLVVTDRDEPMPVADAIADPLAGLAAAIAATEALASDEARLIDVSMLHVAADTLAVQAGPPEHAVVRRHDAWWVEYDGGECRIREARRRDEP